MSCVLVIEDDPECRTVIKENLKNLGYQVAIASNEEEGLEAIRTAGPDVLLLELTLTEKSGFSYLPKIRELDAHLPIIFVTEEADSENAIEAMQLGAFDFLPIPIDLESLNSTVRRATRSRKLMKRPVALGVDSSDWAQEDAFIGRSSEMLEVFKVIGRVADQSIPVLVRGESGTGKELVARAMYHHSVRKDKPFAEVNCAALSETLLESELFGHEKGAFTGATHRRIGKFENCHGGTIFLDEVGDMAPLVQAKVLRLLQEQRFERVGGNETIETDVRIIAATNRPLEKLVESGKFRSDLLYRLNGVTIKLPPLRERGEDILLLLKFFLTQAVQELGYPELTGISTDALATLENYPWPGNVRELRSVIRQSVLNSSGTVITKSFLPQEVLNFPKAQTVGTEPESEVNQRTTNGINLVEYIDQRLAAQSNELYAETLELMERYLIARVLQETDGNQSQAAEILGITRGKIRDRIATFGINLNKSISVSAAQGDGNPQETWDFTA